ncbi:MAG: DUF1311 domain-containing protein [Nitrospirae bacterium]|nr:DUF1311 domain-containing protein [Nitrospirota bacterium]
MLKRKKILVILSLLFAIVFISFSVTLAQEQNQEYPIDKGLAKCINSDSSTAGMRDCFSEAYDMWDKELNKIYKDLMKKLSPKGQKTLKEAQTLWIKYRDAEFKLNDEIIGNKDGTTL